MPSSVLWRKSRGRRSAIDVADSLSGVFVSCFPYGQPFLAALSRRMIVGLILDELDPDQFAALSKAARDVGDDRLYYAVVSEGETEGEHWPVVPVRTASEIQAAHHESYLEEYRKLAGPNRTQALWSPTARWGLLVTSDWFGVVGAVDGFMETFEREWPPWPPDRARPDTTPPSRQVELFVETLREDPTFEMKEFLTYMYGERRAHSLLTS